MEGTKKLFIENRLYYCPVYLLRNSCDDIIIGPFKKADLPDGTAVLDNLSDILNVSKVQDEAVR